MKQLIKISILLVFLLLVCRVKAQQWKAPKPIMTNNILRTFLEMHLTYPLEARENKEEGTVLIGFSVDDKGKVEERHILESVSSLVDSSALELFDLIIWQPAEKYGKAVKCPASDNNGFPVKFNIRKYNKLVKKRAYDYLPQPFQSVDLSNSIYTKTQLDRLPSVILDSTISSLNEYIYSQITYPEEAARYNITGVVRLSIVIETSGLLSNLLVKEAVGGGCTEETIRVVYGLKWTPGIKDGVAVRTQCELSIKFENPAYLKDKHIPNQQNSGI
jgi:TonB family protein